MIKQSAVILDCEFEDIRVNENFKQGFLLFLLFLPLFLLQLQLLVIPGGSIQPPCQLDDFLDR